MMAADLVRRFGIEPRAALISHSNFGTSDAPSAVKMRRALALLRERAPGLMVDGEMHADAALSEAIRQRSLPDSTLKGSANLLVMPNIDAANIAFNMVKSIDGALSVGPILLGMAKPVHVVTTSVTVRGLVNMTAVAAADAILREGANSK